MATLERQTHRVGASLEVREVEDLLGQLEAHREAPCAWHLDLSTTRHVQPLAGGRLAAAMRQMATEHLSVTLPPDEGGQRFRVLYRTGLLAAIAAHADELRGGDDELLARVRSDAQSYSAATNLIVFNRVDEGSAVVRKDRFASRLWAELSRHVPAARHGLAKDTQQALVEVGYEGVANIVDHAYARPLAEEGGRAALCMITWHKEIRASSDDRLGLSSYIERAQEELGDSLGWLAMALIDDGNGIPARQALDSEIYLDSAAVEEEALAEALEKGESVKLAAGDAALRGDPGWGLALMSYAVVAARGYGCIRTGREMVEVDAFSARLDWTLRPDRLAPLRGTVLEFILPVTDPQGTLL
jgi:hypothetical protein